MILYNTSYHIDPSIESEFIHWLKNDVAVAAERAGFVNPLMTRLLRGVDDDCRSFAVQYTAEDLSVVEKWESVNIPVLMNQALTRWGERMLSFSTPMEIMDL